MAVNKTVVIDGKEVRFRASAAVPRLYRNRFGKDIFTDLNKLSGQTEFDVESLEMFENIAYIMAYHADPTIPQTADDWLEGFNTFSIYEVLPEIVELWGMNMKSNVNSKKK